MGRILLPRNGTAIPRHCGWMLTRMDIAIPRHRHFLPIAAESVQRMRLKGETNVFSLENPTSFIRNCFPFLSLELFRFGEGRNRVCSSSIPSEAYDIIDLRATARTVGFLRFGEGFHYGIRGCNFCQSPPLWGGWRRRRRERFFLHSAFCIPH